MDNIAIFGLPCQIHGIRKAQRIFRPLNNSQMILIGLFCGGSKSRMATRWVFQRFGFNYDKLASIRYRGEGWPGNMTAEFNDGMKMHIGYMHYAKAQFNGFAPWRCRLCSDGLAELADISIGDAWLKEFVESDTEGTSLIVSRSLKGEELLSGAFKSGAIEVTLLNNDAAALSQRQMLINKKINIKAIFILAQILGKHVPKYDNIAKGLKFYSFIIRIKEEARFFAGRISAVITR